ncbi:ABC transporter permease [Streptomyces sp. NPDC060194]|uniref:ABC transporter permease n=1 Tax=Streptomyces sp. NPDC060194 TaxID=3347069 RepID=UPI00365EE042
MSAVWRASRAAVNRRRLQTFLIGLVVLCSTTTVLLALGLLVAASGPFDRAYAAQRGAHVIVTFDASRVTSSQLVSSTGQSGVEAAAGPFAQTVLDVSGDWLWMAGGTLTVVGRADPGGPVDRIEILEGRWATAPGEIVVNWSSQGSPGPELLGTRLKTSGGPTLEVVGFATSMSRSASAWVAPEQIAALEAVRGAGDAGTAGTPAPRSAANTAETPGARDTRTARSNAAPDLAGGAASGAVAGVAGSEGSSGSSLQMLYRFSDAGTEADVAAGLARATEGLPAGAVAGSQSYLALKQAFSALADAYLPFMTVFGVLGLLVSALIVGNVVSGAVVSGYRHIGVLKALGFTPRQVVAVYLTMLSVPAVAGAVLGTLLGNLLAGPILGSAFSGIEVGRAQVGELAPWVSAVCLVGMPALVVLTALVPALRAHRLPAVRAISAGSAPLTGRGLRVQRWLAGTRLPRAVGLGLGRPFARPARSLLTLAAIVLGVTTVTLTTGLTGTMLAFAEVGREDGGARVFVSARDGERAAALTDRQIEQRLRALPDTAGVRARAFARATLAGHSQELYADFYRGDDASYARTVVEGRGPVAAGEIVAGPGFLDRRGLSVGDGATLRLNGRELPVRVVGRLIEGSRSIEAAWPTYAAIAPGSPATEYTVRLVPGADAGAYAEAVRALDPRLRAEVSDGTNTGTTIVVGFSTVFTVLLTAVAALGVLHTVLLDVRERRRDLGVLKSIGMTPRQVVVMTVTSVAGLGAVGGVVGIPLGVAAHRYVVDAVGAVEFTAPMKDVWHAPQLAGLLLAGVVIAVLGALPPARGAARTGVGAALRTE